MKRTLLFWAIAALFCSCEKTPIDDPGTLPTGMHTVDLGLPSGIKWAKCNLGSIRPEESGYWFSWGNPIGYKLSENGDVVIADKYDGAGTILEGGFIYNNFSKRDSFSSIDPETGFDAARELLGEHWRLPTNEEFNELLDPKNTEWQWVEDYNSTGVNGWLFKSVRPGYDEPLFLPAVGGVSGNQISGVNDMGLYWSSRCQGSSFFSTKDRTDVMFEFFGWLGGSVRAVYSEDPTEGIKGIKLGKSSVNMKVKDKLILTATVETEPNVINKAVSWESSNQDVAIILPDGTITAYEEGTTTITATTNFGGFTATCEVTVFKGNNGHEYVDLGLPSGTKWSIMNVGSNSPSEFGSYYAWGETRTDTEYIWEAYDLCALTNTALMKYNTSKSFGRDVDNKTILEAGDDAASVSWGGSWRTPTKVEWNELINNCNWTWTTIEGTSGYKVQSKIEGYTEKWIFLPASGQTIGYWTEDFGSNGYYWSSSLYTASPDQAEALNFSKSTKLVSGVMRCNGLIIRPVFD